MLDIINDSHQRIDIHVTNAGVQSHIGAQLKIKEKAYDAMWDINVKSAFFLIKESK